MILYKAPSLVNPRSKIQPGIDSNYKVPLPINPSSRIQSKVSGIDSNYKAPLQVNLRSNIQSTEPGLNSNYNKAPSPNNPRSRGLNSDYNNAPSPMNPRSGLNSDYNKAPSPINPRSTIQSEPGLNSDYNKASLPMNLRSTIQSTESGIDLANSANIYQYKSLSSINNPNSRSTVSDFVSYQTSDSDDEIFSLNNLHNNVTSHKQRDVYNSHSLNIPLSIGNTPNINLYSTSQPNLVNNVCTTASSTTNELFFQNETYLIQWLKTRKDLVLQVLNEIFSLPDISGQVSKIYFY